MRPGFIIALVSLTMLPTLAWPLSDAEFKAMTADGARAAQTSLLVAQANCPLDIPQRAWKSIADQAVQGGIDLNDPTERARSAVEVRTLHSKITNMRAFCDSMRPTVKMYQGE